MTVCGGLSRHLQDTEAYCATIDILNEMLLFIYFCHSVILLKKKNTGLQVSWTARKSNQSILKAISPEYSLKGLMLKLKLPYFGHLMRRTDSLERFWGRLKAGGEGDTEDEMVGWHH